jgi:hypothetical protein
LGSIKDPARAGEPVDEDAAFAVAEVDVGLGVSGGVFDLPFAPVVLGAEVGPAQPAPSNRPYASSFAGLLRKEATRPTRRSA